jgi:O-antigen/teichoic acid export membrane protein
MLNALHSLTARLLPRLAYHRLIGDWNKDGFKKYFFNTGWMFLARVVAFVVSFFVIAVVARYLGPENLGKLSYAQSLVAIFSMFASLGLDQILYRELIANPKREKELLGTAALAKLLCGGATLIVTILTSLLIGGEPLLTWLVAIIALSFIFQPLGVVGHVFSARVRSKYPSYANIIGAFAIAFLKIVVVFFEEGLLYFAVIIAFEILLNSILLYWLYAKVFGGSLINWRVSFSTFKALLSDSWPLMFAGVTGYIYTRIDQVMLKHLIDATAVGLYEVAVRLTEPLSFIPGIIIGSLFPAIINARGADATEYRRRLRSLTTLCLGLSAGLAAIVFIFSAHIVELMFGSDFRESAAILRIYVWSTVGSVAMALMYNYFIAEHRTYLHLIYTAGGAVINVLLNMLLIPPLGASGAAYATLLTVAFITAAFLLTRRPFTFRRGGGE